MKTCLIIEFLFFSSLGLAQNPFQLGLKVNLEMSNFYPGFARYNPGRFEYSPKLCLGGGLIAVRYLSNTLGVETGITYFNRGWIQVRHIATPKPYLINFSSNLNYLSLPLLLRIKYNFFYLSPGFSYDYAFIYYERLSETRFGNRGYHFFTDVTRERIKRHNFSLICNVGYELKLFKNLTAGIELRYNTALLNSFVREKKHSKFYNIGFGVTALHSL